MKIPPRAKIVVALLAVVGAVLLVLFFMGEPIQEGQCKLVREKADSDGPLVGMALRFTRPLNDRPSRMRDLPSSFEQPRYYEIMSGDQPVLMVADFSQKLTRLCIDTDGDGILSEERCLTAEVSEETPVSSRSQRFGPVTLVCDTDAVDTSGGVYLKCFRQDARGLLMPVPAYIHTGKLRLAGRTYRVALTDGDYDGAFRSVLSFPLADRRHLGCDLFAIDLNDDGTFEMSNVEGSEVMPLGKLLKVEDRYYAVDIAPNGKRLALNPAEPQFGTLAIESDDADIEMSLWSDTASQYLQQGRQWPLPAGEYSAFHAVLTKTDASGRAWEFSSNPFLTLTRLGPLDRFTIEPGKTTSLKVGPPFVLKADVEEMSTARRVSITPTLVGCSGEEYISACPRGQTRPAPVAMKIVGEDGTVLLDENLTYT